MENYYLFEVLENYIDSCAFRLNGVFLKGQKFIGWEQKDWRVAVKSNMDDLCTIPLSKVKPIYKINFEKI